MTNRFSSLPQNLQSLSSVQEHVDFDFLANFQQDAVHHMQANLCLLVEASPATGMSPAAGSFEAKLGTLAKVAANYFPLWLIIACSLGLIHPPALLWFRRDLVTAGLALTMMSMGTTLSVEVRHHSRRRLYAASCRDMS